MDTSENREVTSRICGIFARQGRCEQVQFPPEDAMRMNRSLSVAIGLALAAVIQRLGIADALKAKSKLTATGEEVGEAVVKGESEFGILPLSEILPVKGVQVLGNFPADVQSFIVMVGGVSGASQQAA